jgi:hypothetical protein
LCNEEHLNYFKFIGRIAGMAVYHGKLLDGKQCSSLNSNPLLLHYTNLWHCSIYYSYRGWMRNVISNFVTHWNNDRVLSIWTCAQNDHVSCYGLFNFRMFEYCNLPTIPFAFFWLFTNVLSCPMQRQSWVGMFFVP